MTAWVLALVLAVASFGAAAQRESDFPDASITTQVQQALARDEVLRSMRIEVETKSGVVSLSGFVRSLEDIAKAAELARGVPGVSRVINGLRLGNPPSRA